MENELEETASSELGKCNRCGEEIGPPFDRETDWLCKQCYDETRSKGGYRPNPSMNNEPIRTAEEREQEEQWKDEIIDKIDREDEEGCAGVPAKLPKRPLVGAGCATADYADSQIGSSVKSSAE